MKTLRVMFLALSLLLVSTLTTSPALSYQTPQASQQTSDAYYSNPGFKDPAGRFYPHNPAQYATLQSAQIMASFLANTLGQDVDIVNVNADVAWFVSVTPCYQLRLKNGAVFNAGLVYHAVVEQGGQYSVNALQEIAGAKPQPTNLKQFKAVATVKASNKK